MMTETDPEYRESPKPNHLPWASLMELLGILARWRRFIVWVTIISTLSVSVVVLFLPKWYKSTASVFAADQTDLLSGFDGVSNLMKSFSSSRKLGPLGGPTEIDRYVAILKSNSVVRSMIDKFNLIELYDYSDSPYKLEKTIKELISNTEVEIQDEGNLTISVFDKDPQRAADMANYYVELLNKTNTELNVQNARGNRIFIEQRYAKNIEDIRTAEESLKSFQLKYGVIALPEQIEASIKAGAEVHATLAEKEIELGVLKRTFSPDHPNIEKAQIEVDEIKRKIREMNLGSDRKSGEMNILVPFRKSPELGAQYIRLYREVEIQYKILQFLMPLYEQAKVEEQRSTPSVVVLDRAVIAERKAKPKVSLYALLTFVVSLVVVFMIVFLLEGISRLRSADPARFDEIEASVRSDWFGLRWKRRS